MHPPILTTKLYLPAPRLDHIHRPRLIDQLNTGISRKLTLISAPAGFGKSTLLSAWVHQNDEGRIQKDDVNSSSFSLHHFKVAWLSLDEGDNSLVRFLTYFVTTLQTIESDLGQGVMVALQSSGTVDVEIVLTNLINEIAEFPHDVVLVLDDYHVIESQPIDQAITFLLDHLPSQMHLVIASRIDPSLPISRLRARGQVAEIRADDLRFSPDEAAFFLNQMMDFDLSAQDVAALGERTEGWIAGLQLAALSMQGFGDKNEITEFVNRFTGSDRFIQDYLADEVLQQCPKETRDFLLQTSIFNRINAALCDAVLEISDSQMILEGLEAANLFIVPLDNERRWYRYHHLFADLLRHHLRQTFPDRITGLHHRASVWHESEGYIDDAIQHAQAADDTARVINIAECHWQEIIHRGELAKLKDLLDSFGPECTTKSAPLSMAYCWILNLTGSIQAIAPHIRNIRSILKEGVDPEMEALPIQLAVIPSLVETMEAAVSLHAKQAEKAKDHAKKAIRLIPSDPNPATRWLLHGAAGFRLAQAHTELGEFEQACVVLLDILEMLKASQNYLGVANTIYQVVTIYQRSEKARQAIALCQDTLNFIEKHQWDKMPPSGLVYLSLAELQVDEGNFDAAKKNYTIGRKLVEPMQSPQITSMVARVEEKLDGTRLPSQPLVEPLSERELDVLQLVAQGLTNREISERLFLALDTIKGHNRRLFRKLGVQNRTEAVNRARELGLL